MLRWCLQFSFFAPPHHHLLDVLLEGLLGQLKRSRIILVIKIRNRFLCENWRRLKGRFESNSNSAFSNSNTKNVTFIKLQQLYVMYLHNILKCHCHPLSTHAPGKISMLLCLIPHVTVEENS